MYIKGPCAPLDAPREKILTYAQVLAYAYITVKFQLRSSNNVRLTNSSLYNKFSIERSPQNGVLGWILGVGAKIFGSNPLGMQRPPIYVFPDILVQI